MHYFALINCNEAKHKVPKLELKLHHLFNNIYIEHLYIISAKTTLTPVDEQDCHKSAFGPTIDVLFLSLTQWLKIPDFNHQDEKVFTFIKNMFLPFFTSDLLLYNISAKLFQIAISGQDFIRQHYLVCLTVRESINRFRTVTFPKIIWVGLSVRLVLFNPSCL